ncbi:sugar transferase [Streptococcus sp. E17BB]|uniref:sugar transferase n=1 Tax=Streptococcus sp. E17BB TaxID=3278714 RepID=UPI00359E0B4B
MYEKYIKRALDIIAALIGLILFGWLLAIVAVLVKIKLGSPVLFTQERPGKDEKIFKLYKFRTMTDQKDQEGNLLPDQVRLTRFGKLLRSTSLDELPSLLNILKGDLSLVGPRPLLVRYLLYYRDEERLRHSVRPGLTGLAQVNGRNHLNWDQRLGLDVTYVKECSFLLDFKILFKTFVKVIKRSDIASGTELMMKDLDVERQNSH